MRKEGRKAGEMDTIEYASLVKKELPEVKKEFYAMGYEFFNWNKGKNTPNILEMLCHQLGALEKQTTSLNLHLQGSLGTLESAVKALDVTTAKASDSSTRLATALNRITFFAVAITAVSLGVEIVKLIVNK